MRAVLVMILIAIPSLMLPGVSSDTTQIVALVAVFAAGLTFFEYVSVYPGLVEFRDAPPFNRLRYLSLLATVLLISTIVRGQTQPTTLTLFIEALGTKLGQAIDVPFSPVRLILLMLPENVSDYHYVLVRTAAGISYLISLLTLVIFVLTMRFIGWPNRMGSFNVWINLPTFDPTTGGDVVDRLTRDSRANVLLGLLLPFVIPVVMKVASISFSPVTLESPHTLIWTMTAWAFLPASLFMRGIAMGRIAKMIANKRRTLAPADAAEGAEYQPA
ncbi:MAG: hypothetical protein WBA91_09935 [Paracoccaceae bacterium]